MSNRPSFVASAPAPSAATAARSQQQQQPFKPAGNGGCCKISTNIGTENISPSENQNNNNNNVNKDAGQLVAMSTGPRLNPHSALKEFNNYLLQVLDANDDEKREIISRLRLVVQAQRSAAAVREDLMKMTMEFNETARNAEELRLALQESREAQRRLEHENRVLAAQVEDDRAKIASLVKLCRAEMSSSGRAKSNALDKDDILLAVGTGRNRAASARNSVFGRGGTSAAAATGGNRPASVSLRAATTNGSSTQAEDGSNNTTNDGGQQLVSEGHPYSNNNVNNNNNTTTTTDIVAQVLQGTASGQVGPDSLVVALRMEGDALKQLIDEQRAAYEASRAAHVRVARDCDRRHYEEAQRMAAEIRSLSDVLVTSTKDLVETRQHANGMQRQLRGEIESLVQRLAEAEKSKHVQSARQTEELRVIAASERNKNVSVTDRLRAKLTHNETKHHTEKETMQKDSEDMKEALAMAQETAARERRLRLRAEEHARLKSQGHESDLGLLRAQLRTLEKKAFFVHAKELQEYASQHPLDNLPTEFVEIAAPENENEVMMNMYFGNRHTGNRNVEGETGMDFDEDDGQGRSNKRAPFNNNVGGGSGASGGVGDNVGVVGGRGPSGRGGMKYDGGAQVAELTTGVLRHNNNTNNSRSQSNGSVQRPSSAMLM